MQDFAHVDALVRERKPWHTLPQPFYTDSALFELDLEAIFARSWQMIGFEAELERPGSYIALTIARTPIVVLRNKRGEIVAFHNSCRHRGSQICATGNGRLPRLVCPYHQWTYDLDGKLLAAQRMGDDFDPAAHGLRSIRVEAVAGCIYVTLGEGAPDFAPFRAALEPALMPHNLRNGKIAHVEVYDEDANWKLVMENGRECHHCAACHPELKLSFPVTADTAKFYPTEADTPFMAKLREHGLATAPIEGDWWQIGRLPFNPGVLSYSMDGRPLVARPLIDVNDGDIGSFRWAIEPNNFCHVAADCGVMINIEPVSALRTRVTAKWIVHRDAVEGVDYDVDRLIDVWDKTNRQDRDLAENNQLGVSGRGYVPGPYSPEGEPYVNRFIDWYCRQIEEFCAGSAKARAA